MKYYPLATLLATVATACSSNSPSSDDAARTASAHAAIGRLIQQIAGKEVIYKPLKWARATPLQAADMGELAVQQQLALWAMDRLRAASFYDTIFAAQDLLRKGYSPKDLQKAALAADAAEHRATKRALTISRMLDSVRRASPQAAPALTAGQRVWHTFQLTNKAGVVKQDSAAFIILSSGTVLHVYPLAQRFWEPDNRDPF